MLFPVQQLMLDKTLKGIEKQMNVEQDSVTRQRLQQQRQIIEREQTAVRQQLAEASKVMMSSLLVA